MTRILKSCRIIILIILPILLILGFSRKLTNNNNAFLPTYTEFLNLFNNMPNFTNSMLNDLKTINQLINKATYNISSINVDTTNLVEAWNSIGGIDAIADLAIALQQTFMYAFELVSQFFISISGFFQAFGYCFVLIFDLIKIPIQFLIWFTTNFLNLT